MASTVGSRSTGSSGLSWFIAPSRQRSGVSIALSASSQKSRSDCGSAFCILATCPLFIWRERSVKTDAVAALGSTGRISESHFATSTTKSSAVLH